MELLIFVSISFIVLDDDCLNSRDLSKTLLGRVKEFASLSNLKVVLKNEVSTDVRFLYYGPKEIPGWVPGFADENLMMMMNQKKGLKETTANKPKDNFQTFDMLNDVDKFQD
ncbi:hypothetical protein Tco_0834758 [Tanacetum coccineum]